MFTTSLISYTRRVLRGMTIAGGSSSLSLAVLCVFFTGLTQHGACSSNVTKLHIVGLYPMSGFWAGGQAQLPATLMAARDINANPNILPGYELDISQKDTKVSFKLFVKCKLFV